MKWILAASLLLNLTLSFLLVRTTSDTAPEPVVIEKITPKVVEKVVYQTREVKVQADAPKEKDAPAESGPQDFEDRFERLKEEREELFYRQGFSAQEVQRIDEIKEKFNARYLEVIPVDQGPNLTFEQRRRIIDIEEGREKEFEKVFGQKRWEKFRRSQEEYNKKQFDEMRSSDKIFVPLEI